MPPPMRPPEVSPDHQALALPPPSNSWPQQLLVGLCLRRASAQSISENLILSHCKGLSCHSSSLQSSLALPALTVCYGDTPLSSLLLTTPQLWTPQPQGELGGRNLSVGSEGHLGQVWPSAHPHPNQAFPQLSGNKRVGWGLRHLLGSTQVSWPQGEPRPHQGGGAQVSLLIAPADNYCFYSSLK
jgi:hypothetical protein